MYCVCTELEISCPFASDTDPWKVVDREREGFLDREV